MKRYVAWVGVVALLVGWLAVEGWAQRDAGAKIRGDFGPGFGRRPSSERTYVRPGMAEREEYRSFSYEPIGVKPGDMVTAVRDGARVMLGREVLGTLPQGTQFKVLKVINGWVGGVIDVGGKQLNGWVWHADLAAATSSQTPQNP
ncbi:MAG: hypothetical protein KatS3mg110_3641 [Pirellulaceae bacterium]|nr:MAG: hypothetical protein KatS3mg110_3641 [Pirellulaceae bacterium]